MANPFDRFDAEAESAAVVANPFDAFDGVEEVEAQPEQAPSMNMARGAIERGGDLLSGLFTAGNAMAEKGEESYPLGGLVWEKGLIPDYMGPEEYAKWRSEQGGDEPLKIAADRWADTDAGYVENHTWEKVKQEFSEGGALSGSAWGEVMAYGAEQGVKSIPDMVAALVALPSYIMARSGEIGEERARNKGKQEADLTDVLEAAPAAVGSAILERIGAKGITEAGAEALGKEVLKQGFGKIAKEGVKAGGKEAATEFMQEGIIEYLGERLGTDAAMSVAEAFDRGAAGAVAGGVYGTGAGTAGAAVNQARSGQQDSQATGAEAPPPVIQDEVQAPTDDNAPINDYEGRPEWATEQTNIFRDGVQPEPQAEPTPEPAPAEPAPEVAANPFDAFDQAEPEPSAPDVEPVVTEPKVEPETPAVPEPAAVVEQNEQPEAEAPAATQPEPQPVVAQPAPEAEPVTLEETAQPAVTAPVAEQEAIEPAAQPENEPAVTAQVTEPAPVAQQEQPVPPIDEALPEIDITAAEPDTEDASVAIEQAAAETNTAPTEGQKEAGNYKKGKVRVQGLDIAIENPKGSTRSGTDPNGKKWESVMAHHYGDIKRTTAADGDNLDVFIGPDVESDRVFVIDQVKADGSFDEHKAMVGFRTQAEARKGYRDNYDKGWKVGPTTRMSMDEFKTWLKDGDTTKPLQPEKVKPEAAAKAEPPAKAAKWTRRDKRKLWDGPDGMVIADHSMSVGGTKSKMFMVFASNQDYVDGNNFATGESLGEAKKLAAGVPSSNPKTETKPAPEQVAAKESSEPQAQIDDFGEKLEGARKDVMAAYRDKLDRAGEVDAATVPLSKSWPEPNYQKMLDEGVPADTVALVRALRDEVPTKPQKSWKLKGWVETVNGLREMAGTLMGNDAVSNKVMEQLKAMKTNNRLAREAQHILGRMDLYQEFGHGDSFKGVTFGPSFYSLYNGEKDVTVWEVERLSKATAFGNMPRTLATGKTREEALANLRKALDKLPESTKSGAAVRFNIYRDRYSNDVFIGKKVGKDVLRLKTFDDDVKAAREYLENNQEALEAQLAKMKEIPSHRRQSNSPRVGVDHRKGGDVTPEAFADTFGFRGVQFGNYVEQGRRQADLNQAYDALMDLAGILDIPAKALSLNGELGLAFGARGKGGQRSFAAHYEPDQVVINLTKKSGAGSLAHEWWHSLDNYFGRERGARSNDRFATNNQPAQSVRPEVAEAFQNIRRTVNNMKLKQRSKELDKVRTKPYWSTTIEMTARSFESYVIERLKDQNASNDYLANIVSEDYWKASEALGMEGSNTYPYPEAAEIPEIRAAYDHFFNVVDTQETESGNVELFSRDGYRLTPNLSLDYLTVSEANAIRDELTLGWKGAPDIIIRDKISQFPQELQLAIRVAGAENDMRGVLWGDDVYLLASRIPDRQAMERVILHEVIGHYGLRKMLGKDMDRVLNQIWASHGGKTRADFIIRRYYPGNTFDVNNKDHRHTVAEELIAHLAEQNRGQTLVQRAVAIIREGLRKLGFTLEFTVDDIVNLLRRARKTVENGGFERDSEYEANAAPASRYSKQRQTDTDAFKKWFGDSKVVDENGEPLVVYHGTGTRFDTFDESRMGSFTGAESATEGFFFTDSRGLAGQFRDNAQRARMRLSEIRSAIDALTDSRIEELADDLGLVEEYYTDGREFVTDQIIERLDEDRSAYFDDRSNFDGPLKKYIDPALFDTGEVKSVYLAISNPREVTSDPDTAFDDGLITREVRAAKAAGNDGLIVRGMLDTAAMDDKGNNQVASDVYVAFRPEQIKSATDNSGTFDPGNPDIRFSREGIPDLDPQPFGPPSDTLLRKTISKIADKHTVLKGVQKNIKDLFGPIDESADAYMAEELFHGKVENDIRLIQENMIEPLTKAMSENDVSLKQLDEFLYALHAPERNKVIAERNPAMPDGGSGMTNAEAAAIIDKVEKSGKLEQYKALAGRVHQMLERRRKILKNAGLLDEETLGAWEASYKFYVPLKGWAADEQQDSMPRAGKGFAISGKESQLAAGRKSKAASPVANTISDLSEAVLRHRKNEVGNAFLNLVSAYPNGTYWRVFTADNPEVDRKVVKRKDPATGKTKYRVEEQVVPMAMMADRYFTTKVDGETYYIKVEDERLLNAMRNIGPDNNGLLVRSLSMVTRLMSSLNTSYNPEFVISNFSRDIQTAILNLTSEQSSEDGKARGKKIAAKTVKNVPTAIRAINASLKGKKLDGKAGEWQKHFDQFRADGAKTGWFDMKDVDGQMEDLETMISMASGGTVNSARRAFRAVTDWVENTNAAIENGVRLSAYVNAIAADIPRAQAASLAKNMTVNFNRRGELGTTMNALYMFANASVQGTANFVRTLGRLNGQKGDRLWSRLNTAQKIAAGMAVGGFALSALNRLVAGDDDDGVNWWDKVPDYVKERNIVIMKSLVGGEPGEYWTIPLPYGYNIFPVVGTSMEQMIASDKPAGDVAGNVVLAALGSFSPIGFEQSEEAYGVIAKNIMPTILRPVASIALNENFMGGPIYKENLPFGTPEPDSSLYFRSTPEAYKKLAKGLNEATGGSDYRSGAVDLSPDVMQFLVGYYGGGAYDFFTSRAPNAALKLAQGVELEDREIPFYRKLHGKVLPYEDQSVFYDRRNEINQLEKERDNLRGRERVEFMKEYGAKIRLGGVMTSVEKRLKNLREQRDRIEAMDLSAAEKDKRLKTVEQRMKQAIDQFNERYNEVED